MPDRRPAFLAASFDTRRSVHIVDLNRRGLRYECLGVPRSSSPATRTIVGVPMLKDDELVGAIVIYRQEVRPFTEKQIELVTKLRRASRHRHREHAFAQRAAPAHRRSD